MKQVAPFGFACGLYRRMLIVLFAALAALAPVAAQAQIADAPAEGVAGPAATSVVTDSAPPMPAGPGAPEGLAPIVDGYILGPGDIIEVSVVGQEEYRARVQVQTDGSVQLPYLNAVPAANKTVLDFQGDIARLLREGGYYNNPAVSVIVASYASRYVVVLGEVARPGLLPVDRNYRLSEIVARAGGIAPTGVDTVSLTRETGEQIEVTLQDMATGGPDKDPMVEAGDRIFVARMQEEDRKLFYIYGQVSAPGSYPLAEGMSLRMALARGGGLTPLGSESRVKVFREGEEMRNVDMSQTILSGDVIRVGERFF